MTFEERKSQAWTERFIKEARQIHGDKFDYSKSIVNNKSNKICIICHIHGEFFQTYNDHLSYQNRCPLCCHPITTIRQKATTL